mgnify:CR=1 FL=1
MKVSFLKNFKKAAVVLGAVAAAAMARPYIVGVDISWVLEDESLGATYYHDGKKMDLFDILADHGVNFIRVRTFVNSCIGYAKESYSGANSNVCWCDLDHTIQLAKRIKAHNMGFFLDFHMSDTWASIGHQNVPASWAGKSNAEMGKLAYQHVKTTMDALVAQGLKPDMVQVGNEINSKVAGVSMSKIADFANIINSGVKAVREIDPNIKIVMQHGQPRPDKGFADWYKKIHENIDYDAICGSTYGTTNNGNDWREMFGLVTKNKKPVLSCEYTGQRTNLVNTVFSEFGDLGWGTFVWEPTRYSEKPMFDRNGQKYTANARLDELAAFAKKLNATLPDWVGSGKKIPKVFVKAVAGIGGSIERSVAGDSVAQGSSLTFTANPLNGWEFVGWKGDATGNNKEFKVEKLEKGVDVSADFRFVGKDSLKYEAENAVFKETVLEAKHEGFSGDGYANLDNSKTSSVTIPVCLPQDVKQEMEIVFANGGTASRPVSISVNGEVQVDKLEMESTGEWTSWTRKSVLLTVPAGLNSITISSLTDDGAPNIDVIEFRKIGTDTDVGDKDVGGDKTEGGEGTAALNRGVTSAESNLQKPFRTFFVNGRAVRSGVADRVANRRHLIRVSK